MYLFPRLGSLRFTALRYVISWTPYSFHLNDAIRASEAAGVYPGATAHIYCAISHEIILDGTLVFVIYGFDDTREYRIEMDLY